MKEIKSKDTVTVPSATTQKTISKSSLFTFNFSKSFKSSELKSWVVLFAFIWPLFLVTLYSLFSNKVLSYVELSEPLLCMVTIYFIGQVLLIGKILIGGYLWLFAMGGYFIVAGIISYGKLQLIMQNKSNNALKQGASHGTAEKRAAP